MKLNYEKLIIILVSILIILILIAGIILYLMKNERTSTQPEIEDIPTDIYGDLDYIENFENKMVKLKNEKEFYYLESILQNFYLYLKMENAEVAYGIVDIEYMEKNNITENNIIKKINMILDSNSGINLTEIYLRDDLDKPIYYCYGIEDDQKEVFFRINKDIGNLAYCIGIISKEEYEDYITEKINEENNKEVTQNKYNKIKGFNLSEEDIVRKYFEDFIYTEANNPSIAYNMLDKEYRDKRFRTFEEYQEYISLNKEKIETLNAKGIKSDKEFNDEELYKEYLDSLVYKGLASYKINNEEDKKIITCIDDYGYYYTFVVSAVMDYTVILDNHTIEQEYWLETYEKADEKEKIILNIEKINDALNTYDYRYIYEKLDSVFRRNNFDSLDHFKEYMKNNVFDVNEFESVSIDQQQDVYITTTSVVDKLSQTNKKIKLNIIMKLKEETDFTMSFSIE